MKKATLFSLLAMLFLLAGSGKVRADELFYTLLTVSSEGTNHTSYNDYFDDEHDGMVWNAPGNQKVSNDVTDRWRIGGKNLDKVDRTITARTPMGSAISRVVLNHFGVSRNTVVVNSMKLTVASDADFAEVLDEVELTPSIALQTAGEVVFLPTASYGTQWATDAYYKLTINLSNDNKSNGGLDIASIQFFAPGSGVYVAKPVITPAGGTFAEPQEVTITAAEGCSIYYTTNGSEPTTATGTLYTQPFTVDTNCTVKAIASNQNGNASSVASAEFRFNNSTFTSIADLCAAASSASTPVLVQFNNWIVTGVKGKNAYFTDGTNGILLYQDGHNFEVGDQLTGTATFNLTIYNDAPEITGLTATTAGVNVTKNATATPQTISISDLATDKQGCLITLKGVTYDGTYFVDADDNKITPYDSFSAGFALEDGQTYDATGVAIWFKPKSGAGYWEIAPRTADEFALVAAAVAKPAITPNGGTFTEAQQVTITAEAGCTVMYTTDGTGPSASAGTRYTAPFTLSQDCTVKAIAIKDGKTSAIATAEFKFISSTAITSIAALCEAAPAEGTTEVLASINNWIVTGVKGNQLFFTDGKNGIVNYVKGHGFEQNDIVNGSAILSLTTFNECPEITNLTSTTEGITVTKGEGAAPLAARIADLEKNMQGCLLSFKGLTYSEGDKAFFDDDDNKIVPNNKFIDLPAFIDGKTYDVTGVAVWFVPSGESGYWAIAPRAAEEIVLVTSQLTPISSWSVESETVDINGQATAVFTTNSDGEVTYESSDETVATIDQEGNITIVGRGDAVITARVAETETYLPDSKSFTLIVTEEGFGEATFAYSDEDIVGQGAPDTGAELTATRNDVLTLYANRAYAKVGDTHIKIYGSKFEGKDEDKTLTDPSYIRLSVPEGYVITDVVLTATGDSYIKEWTDQNGNAATIEGNVATWSGELSEVTLTNQSSAQARIKTIEVAYKSTGSASEEGDLNGDGKVDIADAVAVLEVMARDGNDADADLNGDGKVDIADFVAVLEIMAKQ